MNIERAEVLLLKTKEVLDFLGVPFWLYMGTLLVAVRDGKLKSDDTDMDIMVKKEDWSEDFSDNFHEIRLCYGGAGKDDIACIGIDNFEPRIDVVLMTYCPVLEAYHISPQYKQPIGLGTFHAVVPPIYLDQYAVTTFLDEKFRIPYKVEEFLEDIYGKDWRIPILHQEWKELLKKEGTRAKDWKRIALFQSFNEGEI